MDTSVKWYEDPVYIKTRVCAKCGLEKHLYDFYKEATVKSGRRTDCKRCNSLYSQDHPCMPDPIKHRESVEKYSKTEKFKEKHREDARNHRIKYPEKVKARLAGQVLQKETCEVCGNPVAEAHHDDYSKPWEVRWLCKKHHEEVESGYESRIYSTV